jgi:hypothetical protein
MSRVKLAVAVALLGTVMTVSAVAIAGGGGKTRAHLSGFQEVPAVLSDGSGKFTFTVNQSTQTIDYTLSYEGLEGGAVSAAHIHIGQRLVNGGVAAFLCGGSKPPCPPSGEVEGTITATDVLAIPTQSLDAGDFDALVRAMRRGLTYVNVHTAQSPGGEIRGQIGDKKHGHHNGHNGDAKGHGSGPDY